MAELKMSFEENEIQLGCFEVGGNIYAIEVSQIREIVRWIEPTPLPKAPALIQGVVDLRDALIPIVDLGLALGGEAAKEVGTSRIVIVDIDDMVLGLRVDNATEVMVTSVQSLETAPALATHSGYDAIRGAIRRAGESPVMVLSLEDILETVFRSAIGDQG